MSSSKGVRRDRAVGVAWRRAGKASTCWWGGPISPSMRRWICLATTLTTAPPPRHATRPPLSCVYLLQSVVVLTSPLSFASDPIAISPHPPPLLRMWGASPRIKGNTASEESGRREDTKRKRLWSPFPLHGLVSGSGYSASPPPFLRFRWWICELLETI
jgi:hypothetical protein